MSWQQFREDMAPNAASSARAALCDRFQPVSKERLELGRQVGSLSRTDSIHRVVPYQEAYSPQIVREILDHVGPISGTVLDPFVGSGTSLLVASERGLPAVGIDILPFAAFAAATLLRAPEANWDKIARLTAAVLEAPSLTLGRFPDFPVRDWAFSKAALAELTTLHDAIVRRRPGIERDLIRLALLTTVEAMSQATRDGTSLRRRPPGGSRAGRFGIRQTRQHVRNRFVARLELLQTGLADQPVAHKDSKVVLGDARELPELFGPRSFRFAMFSPPYPNRYDYSAKYQLELGFGFTPNRTALRALRRSQLRSHLEAPWPPERTLDVPALDEFLAALLAATDRPGDTNRVFKMIAGYFEDMSKVLKGLRHVVAPGSPVGIVVGTQVYRGEALPTDLLIAEIAEDLGYKVREIWVARYKGVAVQQRLRGATAGSRESVLLLTR